MIHCMMAITDGTPDWNQSNVTSFWNYSDEYYLTLAVPSSYILIDVRAIDNPSPGNAPKRGISGWLFQLHY